MRAREIRERLKGKCEPNVMYCLEALAEQQVVIQQQLLECAQAVDQMSNIITDFTQVATNMKNTVERLQGIKGDDIDEPTH